MAAAYLGLGIHNTHRTFAMPCTWTDEDAKIAQTAMYAVLIGRRLTARWLAGPASGIYTHRLDSVAAMLELKDRKHRRLHTLYTAGGHIGPAER